MKILVSHVFSFDNKGDAALLSVLIDDLKQAFSKDVHIDILSMDNHIEDETFDGYPVYRSFAHFIFYRYQNKALKLAYSLFVMIYTIIWSIILRYVKYNIWLPSNLRNIVRMYEEADLIVPVGGGYIRGKSGVMSTMSLAVTLHPLVIGNILNKATVIYSQSVGPFANKIQASIAKVVLKRVRIIIVREDLSKDLLKQMGISRNVIRSIDGGFAFTSDIKKNLKNELNIPSQRIIVGVTVRKWLSAAAQKRFEEEMAKFIDGIIERYGVFVIFIPQVTSEFHGDDDRIASHDVWKHIKNRESAVVLTDSYDHRTIKAIYHNLDLMIGNRFHSVIFSLTSFVPSIAIEYEHKTSGIMQDLVLNKWVIKMEDVTNQRLNDLFTDLLISKEAYRGYLRNTIPRFVNEAKKLPIILRKEFSRSGL